MGTTTGRVIILNGTSSSGKSTVARELQALLPDYAIHTGIDHFSGALPRSFYAVADEGDVPEFDGLLQLTADNGSRVVGFRLGARAIRLKEGMYRAVRELADAGFDVIVDDVILDERVMQFVSKLFAGIAYFVAIRCPLEETIRREAARGDRNAGWAEAQYDTVHRYGGYDLECDTSESSARECAEAIVSIVEETPTPRALAKMS